MKELQLWIGAILRVAIVYINRIVYFKKKGEGGLIHTKQRFTCVVRLRISKDETDHPGTQPEY